MDWLITFLLFIFPAMGGLLFGALLNLLFSIDKRTCCYKVKVLQQLSYNAYGNAFC